MKRSKKYLFVIAAVVVVAAVAVCVRFLDARRARQADLRYLQQTEYDSVFFSMVPYKNMEEDAIGADLFSHYFAWNTATVPKYFRNADDLNEYLETALNSGNTVNLAGLELIPFKPGRFEGLGELIGAHPETTFHIILAAPSMGYWTSQSEKSEQKQRASYQKLAEELLQYSNVELCFAGTEDWLVMNPGNYSAPLVAKKDITEHVALLTWSNQYRLTVDNYAAVFAELEEKIRLARTAPAPTDLTDWCLVFFGDSIIGNYTDSTSIPNMTASLSGCEAYNLGIGGTSACVEGSDPYPFPVIVEKFCGQETITLPEKVICPQEMAAYYEREHNGKQMCFVVNYGLNDYFGGVLIENPEDPFDLDTYTGALRSGIRDLRAAFPESVIVLAAPGYVDLFSQGQGIQSDVGGVLTDYVEAAGRVAQETNAIFMNNYYDLGVDASNSAVYLVDRCHLGDNGRFLYAQALIRLIQREIDAKRQ